MGVAMAQDLMAQEPELWCFDEPVKGMLRDFFSPARNSI
jgi:hypothetical protein